MVVPALIALVLAGDMDPYNRSRTRVDPKHCVHWKADSVVEWRANDAGNPETPGATEFDAMRAAFKTWNDAMAACASVSFKEGPGTSSTKIGRLTSASEIANNENIVVFRTKLCSDPGGAPMSDSCWINEQDDDDCGNKFDCWDEQTAMIALTLTTFDPGTGVLQDADFEFNARTFVLSTVDTPPCVAPIQAVTCVAFDLQNTLTHEIGHALGLDHTMVAGSTMFPSAPLGETSKRVLDPGTKSFTCDVYPKGEPSTDCVLKPVSPTLGDVRRGCGCGAGPSVPFVLALALLWRRRRVNEHGG